jgi:hypothetical protein
MARKPEKKANGRPTANIDKEMFEKLCSIQCIMMEICDWFRVDDVTLDKWCKRTYGGGFSEIYQQKRSFGKISLRRSQFQNALEGRNPTMQIWLGKQYLGQSDKTEVKSDMNISMKEAEELPLSEIKERLRALLNK